MFMSRKCTNIRSTKDLRDYFLVAESQAGQNAWIFGICIFTKHSHCHFIFSSFFINLFFNDFNLALSSPTFIQLLHQKSEEPDKIKHQKYKYSFCAKECSFLILASDWLAVLKKTQIWITSIIQEVQECQGWRQAGTRSAPVEVYKYHRTTWSNSISFSSLEEEQLGITQGKNDNYKNFQICKNQLIGKFLTV